MKKLKQFAVVFSIMVVVVILTTISSPKLENKNYQSIDIGWNISINDKAYLNESLSTFRFPLAEKGDRITLENSLSDGNVSNPILKLYTIHSEIHVFLEGEEIYSYGKERNSQGKLLGYGYHFIELPKEYGGKSIKIILSVSENQAFGMIEVPEICNGSSFFRDFISIKKVPLAITIFLIIFGLLIVAITTCIMVKNKKIYKLLCVALFSVGIGCWSFCNYDLVILFTDDLLVKAFLEFASLYFCVTFVFAYFRQEALENKPACTCFIYKSILGVQIVFMCSAYLLQALNWCHFPKMLKYEHIIIVFMIVYFSWMFTYEFIKGQFKNHTIVIGIVIMIFFISSDLLRFNLQKYTQVFGNQKFTSQICIGTLIFVITLLLDFCLEIGRMLYEMAQRETLEGIAYTDVLTGLVNRRKCEEIFDELEKLEIPYEIINFDLNGLKIVNDQLGHDCGDQLIKEFSKILKVVFSDYATVGRMGGDEFIVIFKNSSNVNIEKLIDTMQRLIEVHNEKDKLIRISTAYGFCSSVENPLFTVKEVYRVADARMYKMKAESKRLRENKVF